MLTEGLIFTLIAAASANSGHPAFESSHETVFAEAGSYLEILCNASGDQPLTYKWYDQMESEISNRSSSIYIRQTTEGSTLIFDSIRENQGGIYTCTASNFHGMASKAYIINVNRTSEKIENKTICIKEVEVQNVTDSSIEFTLRSDKEPETIYVLYNERVEKLRRTLQFKGGEKVVLRNLIPSGHYKFDFYVEAPPGFERCTTISTEVTFLPDVPDVIVRSFNEGILQIEWFRKIDDFYRETINKYLLSYSSVMISNGSSWKENSCVINIEIPSPCFAPRYSIANLSKNVYYEIRLAAHTSQGYGKPYKQKILVS